MKQMLGYKNAINIADAVFNTFSFILIPGKFNNLKYVGLITV